MLKEPIYIFYKKYICILKLICIILNLFLNLIYKIIVRVKNREKAV